MIVRPAKASDIQNVLNLENRLRENRKEAEAQGFLLAGGSDTPEQYVAFTKEGPFFVAENAGNLVGFVFALGPESERMRKLKLTKDKFDISNPEIFDLPNLSWLAKVGVEPALMGQKVATELYRKLFSEYPHYNFLTTTVFSPMRNMPSEKLQEKFGFKAIGTLPLGDRGALKGVVCKVYIRIGNCLAS